MQPSTYLAENWPWLILSCALLYISVFIVKFIRHRRFYADLPTPPHSLFWGNLKVMGEGMKNYPADMHPQPLFTDLAVEHKLRGLYYMDLYPFAEPFLFILDPALALQTQTSSMFFRHPFVLGFLGGLVGTKSIFTTQGKEWQQQRSWFAPAFSLSHLLTLVPGMIEETLVFKENLTNHAVSGDVFSMNEEAMKLTIDIIGRSVGDIRLRSQSGYSPIQDAFAKAIEWSAGHTDPIWKKILSPTMMWWYTRKLDTLLGEVIKEKYTQSSEDGVDKSILDLALRGYLKDSGRAREGKAGRIDQDPEFMKIALDNAKTFFTGGHDTTSSLVTYTYHLLSSHPKILSRVRAEHDQVFGAGFQTTLSTLQAEPHLLNKLPLTAAVLKEVLRVHPAGFTVRKGAPGATLTFEGRTYPADNHMIGVLTPAMHRAPEFFTNPLEFDPDRWLGPGVDKSGAWQPFEKGPRNCIGQQLALLEVKLIAVLTLREFDFEAKFKENAPSIPGWGGKAYQELKLTAKPKDGIPMRVKLRRT